MSRPSGRIGAGIDNLAQIGGRFRNHIKAIEQVATAIWDSEDDARGRVSAVHDSALCKRFDGLNPLH